MKNSLLKMLSIFSAMALSITLTSCGDDDDEPKMPEQPATPAVASYKVTNSVECAADVYKYFDVTVTYTESDGSLKTVTVTAPFNKTVTINAASAPSKAVLKAQATPKTDHPAIDADVIYHLDRSHVFTLSSLSSTGQVIALITTGSPTPSKLSLNGTGLLTWIEDGRILKICDSELELK